MEGIELLRFVPFDSFLYAVDILGYSFMSLATLFAARVFAGDGLERTARWFLTANGLLLPFLALQMYFHSFIWGGALWAVTFLLRPGPSRSSSGALKRRPRPQWRQLDATDFVGPRFIVAPSTVVKAMAML